jgi:hypothetical protein
MAMLQTAFYFSDLEQMKISGCQALIYMLSTTKYSKNNADLRVWQYQPNCYRIKIDPFRKV